MKYYKVSWMDTFDFDHYCSYETEESLRKEVTAGNSNMQRKTDQTEISKEEYEKATGLGTTVEIEIVNGKTMLVTDTDEALKNCISYLVTLKGIELKSDNELYDAVEKIVSGKLG